MTWLARLNAARPSEAGFNSGRQWADQGEQSPECGASWPPRGEDGQVGLRLAGRVADVKIHNHVSSYSFYQHSAIKYCPCLKQCRVTSTDCLLSPECASVAIS